MTDDDIDRVEMLLGWELDPHQRRFLELVGDLTPDQGRLAVLRARTGGGLRCTRCGEWGHLNAPCPRMS